MKITPSDNDSGRRVLQVEAYWSELAADYEDIVAAYSDVRVPGFRPGKVPRSVIENRLHKQILDDFSQRVAKRLGREAVRQADREPFGPVEISDIECGTGKPFQFNVSYWPMPEIELPELGALYKPEDGADPRDLISKRLLELVSSDVPDELVQAELGDEEINGNSGDAAWKAAADRVRLMLILKKIAGREGIEVSESDVEKRIREKADEFETKPETLRAELERGGGLQRLKDMLLAELTLDYLLERNQYDV
jgi:FKBP-type peptidyl-prolyl cis-trans isomerase (trigger factor)